MFEKLKNKWGIESNFQVIIILIVFAITGSSAAKISGPITAYFELDDVHVLLYWPIRLLIVFPAYQLMLVLFGLLGSIIVSILTFQINKYYYNFFLKMSIIFSKKMIKFLSFGILFRD
ncbi:diacylglyceryl transferase [Flavobacteriaceae bacterium]|jgi:manganese efflux pump family protein|nr:diacylglyceryl transferase [Flavobacteriaceae bacterium]MDB9793635.1 diacylglyceryl transferase [Flavobacteriaceae bacterium]|tara:strand:+ start:151 stop:504 length:354 start_codon:yes stop_codon:yes gene_type:complete